eukprot:scaffold23372_cov66-Phaeocystis_antarctica.AAC.6
MAAWAAAAERPALGCGALALMLTVPGPAVARWCPGDDFVPEQPAASVPTYAAASSRRGRRFVVGRTARRHRRAPSRRANAP